MTAAVPSTVAPTLEMTVEDATDNFLELGKYLQTQSKLKIKVVAAGAYGSKIKTISVTADGTTYNNALSTPAETAEYSFTTGVLNGEGTQGTLNVLAHEYEEEFDPTGETAPVMTLQIAPWIKKEKTAEKLTRQLRTKPADGYHLWAEAKNPDGRSEERRVGKECGS